MIKRYMMAAVVSLALLGGACGGSDKQSNGVASVNGQQASSKDKDGEKKQNAQDAALAYAKCMRKNGAEVPDPDARGMFEITPGSKMPDEEAMKKGDEACKAERSAMQGSIGGPDKDLDEKALKMARCLREQGIDVPDPKAHEGGGTSMDVDEDKINDPAFKKAMSTCSKQVGMPEPGAAAGSGK